MVLNWGDLETAERIKGASDELLEDINSKTSLKFIIFFTIHGWYMMVYTPSTYNIIWLIWHIPTFLKTIYLCISFAQVYPFCWHCALFQDAGSEVLLHYTTVVSVGAPAGPREQLMALRGSVTHPGVPGVNELCEEVFGKRPEILRPRDAQGTWVNQGCENPVEVHPMISYG